VDTGCVSANAHDASIYRPRFIDVPTSAFNASAATAATVSATAAMFSAPSYGINDAGPASMSAAPAINAAGTSLSSAATSGATIDGVSDWYDQWGPLAGGCPSIAPPSSLNAAQPTPDGQVTLTWPTVGTDVWYYGYQADLTANTSFSQMWGGLWAQPSSSTASTASGQAAPVTSASVNGDTFAWYIQPFGAGGSTGPVGRSPTASEAVSIQPPSAPTGLAGGNGSGAAGEFLLDWNDVTYPSSAVYYWLYYWDVTAGQTQANATRAADPLPPGSTYIHFTGVTPASLSSVLTPGHTYGFYVVAENLGGYSPPSNTIEVGPSPVCDAGVIDAGSAGIISVTAADDIFIYVQNSTNLPDIVDGGAPSVNMDFQGTEPQSQTLWPAGQPPTFGLAVFQFSDGPAPSIAYNINYSSSSDAPASYSVTSAHC
jgi:hypothetical protein